MRYRTEDLRSVPIDDVAVALGLQTRRSGTSITTRCTNPSHDDRHPSMSLDSRRNRFKCFACGNTGTPVDLVMQILTLDFPAAADWLGRAFNLSPDSARAPYRNISAPPDRLATPPSRLSQPRLAPTPQLPSPPNQNSSRILDALLSHLGALPRSGTAYLESRGISLATAARARLAFLAAPARTDRFLRTSFSLDDLIASGLYTSPDAARNRPPTFRFFRHPLLFPVVVDGSPVFIQGRRLDGDARPKYLSAGGSIPAPYNADILRSLSPGSRVLIAEGPIDTLTLVDRGYPAVGIFGVENFKSAWVPLFRDLDVVLVLDADPAGRKGTAKLASIFAAAGQRVRSVALPEGADVNAFFTGSVACNP